MPEGLPRAAILEAALLALPGIEDAAVVERTALDGSRHLIGYLVSSGAWTPEAWHDALLPAAAGMPADFVSVSSLPLTPEGEIDVDALATIPVIDVDLVARHGDALSAVPGVTNVQIRVEEVVFRPTRSHLADLVPRRHRPSAAVADRAGTPEPAGDRNQPTPVGEEERPAIASGPDLTRPTPRNLAAVLRQAAATRPTHGVTSVLADGAEHRRSYQELLQDAERALAGLRANALEAGDAVLLQLDDDRDAITMFWACALGGFVPAPVGVPPSYQEDQAGVAKLRNAWSLLGRPVVVASRTIAAEVSRLWDHWMPDAVRLLVVDDLLGDRRDQSHHDADADAVALILLTSGSTGVPKGVALTHANVIARSAATAQANAFTDDDRLLNWFPLDHVGGIVMYHLLGTYLAAEQVQAATAYVLQEPLRWLDLLERHRTTMTWAPNFAFGLVCGNDDGLAARRRDLSSVRFILNGGEAVVAATARRFLTALAPHGLAADVMHPAWGMSETSSGVTFSDRFTAGDPGAEPPFVEVGAPIPGVSVRVVDASDQVVREGSVGRLQVTGRPVTSGYLDNPELNAEAFSADGWFNTGDLAVLHQGRLTITGRSKDVIIVNGANLHSHEIEAVAEDVPGVERSFTAACGVRPDGADTDRVCVFFSPIGTSWPHALEAVKGVQDALVRRMGLRPDYVVPVQRHQVPKTAIGKIQRSQLKARFEAGEFDDVVKRVDLDTASTRTLPNWFFERTWTRRAVPEGGTGQGRYLVFTDRLGLAEATRRALTDGPTAWVVVEASDTFAQVDETRFRIDPTRREDYLRLAAALAAQHVAIDRVLHLWSYAAIGGRRLDARWLARAQYDGALSLLFIAQSLERFRDPDQTTHLVYVSTGAQCAPGDVVLAPEKGTATGLLKTLALEMPFVSCCHVDFNVPSVERDGASLAAELRGRRRHSEVAYRGGSRLEAWLTQLDLARESFRRLPIDDGGLYLITGGLGGIATELAQFLLRQHHVRLLLVGATPLPAVGGADDSKAHLRLQRYRALAAGADDRLLYRSLDVGDAEAVGRAIVQAETRWDRRLAGVFHLASIVNRIADEHRVAHESPPSVAAIFAPKLGGAQVLFDVLDDRHDVLFVAFTSALGVVGGANYCAYAAANSGLDALVAARRAAGFPNTYSFAWTAWDGVGISETVPDYVRQNARDLGYRALSAKQAVQSMLAGLCREPRSYVIGLDPQARFVQRLLRRDCQPRQRLAARYTAATSEDGSPARDRATAVVDRFGTSCPLEATPLSADGRDGGGPAGAQSAGASTLAPRNPTEALIAGIWRDLLVSPEIGVQERFFDLGGDSLLAMRLINRLRETFGVDVPLSGLFRDPTIEGLSAIVSAWREPVADRADVTADAFDLSAEARVSSMTDDEVEAMLRRLAPVDATGK